MLNVNCSAKLGPKMFELFGQKEKQNTGQCVSNLQSHILWVQCENL